MARARPKSWRPAAAPFAAMCDFVLTFEEVMGMFEAKAINFAEIAGDEGLNEATADGRGFAVSGGVAQAVVNVIKNLEPEREVKVMAAQGLRECKKMLMLAKAGKLQRLPAGGHGLPRRLCRRAPARCKTR